MKAEDIRLDDCQNIGMCTATCPKGKTTYLYFFKYFLGLDPQKSLQTLIEMVKQYRTKHVEEEAL